MFIARRLLEPYYRNQKDLESDLKLSAESSRDDDELFAWLSGAEDVWASLAPVFGRRLGTRKGFGAWLLEADGFGYQLNPDQRRIGAFFVVLELREFGGHTLWNRLKSAPHYEDILQEVHERVAKRFARTIPEAPKLTVQERELSLSAMLLGESLDKISPEHVEELLKDAQFMSSSDYNEIKKGLRAKLSGGSGPSLKQFKSSLGKSVAKRFGLALVESAWGASKLASHGRVGSIAARVLPFALRRAGLYLSLGFLLRDAYQLAGEATRVTNPAVIIISLYRSLSED